MSQWNRPQHRPPHITEGGIAKLVVANSEDGAARWQSSLPPRSRSLGPAAASERLHQQPTASLTNALAVASGSSSVAGGSADAASIRNRLIRRPNVGLVPLTKLAPLKKDEDEKERSKSVILAPNRFPGGETSALELATGDVQLLTIDSGADQRTQRQQLTRWMDSFTRELDLHKNSSVTVELMLRQVMEATRHLPAPNPLRLAVCCVLSDKMVGIMGRYGDILGTLMTELFSAIYQPVGSLPSEEYVADRLMALGINPNSGVQRYLARKPYFEGFKESVDREDSLRRKTNQLQRSIDRQQSVVNSASKAWQLSVKRCVFRAWRGGVLRERLQLISLNGFLNRARRRDILQTHFYAYRAVVHEQIAERTRLQMNEGVDLIIQKEASASVKAMEIEDRMEETRMVAVRLKEEKEHLISRHKLMEEAYETALFKADEWRKMTINAVNFIGSIREKLSQIKHVWGSDFASCGELAVRVILGWARSIVTMLPGRAKTKCNNFGSDMRDGTVYICLLHVVTQGEVSLLNLEHKNTLKRMEIVLDALNTLNINLALKPTDLMSGSTDYAFLLLFSLWSHYALPPTPQEEVGVGEGHRDDLEATENYLDECRAYYPSWLEQRSVLSRYALYVLVCRANQIPAKLLSAQEERELHADLQLMAVKQTSKIPDVFVALPFMNGPQKAANEEERTRVNEVILKHLSLLRSTFVYYASQSIVDDGKKRKKTQPKKKTKEKAPLGGMDFTGFYRFCCDCRLVSVPREEHTGKAVHEVDKSALSRKDAKAMAKAQMKATEEAAAKEGAEAIHTGPGKQFTKAQCFNIFGEVKCRFNPELGGTNFASNKSTIGLDPEAQLAPNEWIAAVLQLAIHRHGAPMVPGSEFPAPGSLALETFVTMDVAPHACVTEGSPFLQEVWSDPVQMVLRKRRRVLMPLYQVFAAMDGDGTMSFHEFFTLMQSCDVLKKYTVLTKDILKDVFIQFGPGGELGNDRTLPKAAKDEDEENAGTTSAAAPQSPRQSPRGNTATPQPEQEDSSLDLHELVYGEFEIALIAISVYIKPAPYIPLVSKLETFVGGICDVAGPLVKREMKKRQEAEAIRRKERELKEAAEAEDMERERQLQFDMMQQQQQESDADGSTSMSMMMAGPPED